MAMTKQTTTSASDNAPPPPPPSNGVDTAASAGPALKKPSVFADMTALRESNKRAFGGESEGSLGVTLGRPKKELYVRFKDDDEFILPAHVWAESDDSRVMHYITNSLWDLEDLQGGLRPVILAAWLGADGSVGIWPVPGSNAAGSWYDSGQEILALGRKEWVRIQTHNKERRYLHFQPKKPIPDRDWPDISFGEMLEKAFGSKVVDSEDHSLIRKLRNE